MLDVRCWMLDVGCWMSAPSALRPPLCALRLALCTALLYHFAVNLQMPPRDDGGMIALAHDGGCVWWRRTIRRQPPGNGVFEGRPILRGNKFGALDATGNVHDAAGSGTKKLQVPRQSFRHDQAKRLLRSEEH